jgi:hypothetical protein
VFISQRHPDCAACTGGDSLHAGASNHGLHPRTDNLDHGLHNPITTNRAFGRASFREDNGMAKKSVLTEAKDTVVTGARDVETFARGLATAAIVAAADAVAGALASRAKPKRQPTKSRTKWAAKKRPAVKAKKKAVKRKAAKKRSARKSAKKKAAPKRAKR